MAYIYSKRVFIILILFIITFSSVLKAQEDCSFTLSKAQKLFDAGTIEQIPQMLQPCIDNGFSDDDKLQAYKLIILSYLFDNNIKEAEKAMLNFLNKNPEYEILPTDQAEFIQLFNTYNTVPLVAIGGIFGINNSNAYATLLRGGATILNPGTYQSTGTSFQGGLAFRRYLTTRIDLNLEAIFLQSSYQYSKPGSGILAESETFTEAQTRIEFPLTGIYNFKSWNKITPFIRGGLNFSYLLSSVGTLLVQTPAIPKLYSNQNISLLSSRIPLQIGEISGIGLAYNLPHSYLILDVRYNIGFRNQVNTKPYSENIYTDNDFKINNLYYSISYYYKFYKPQKKKVK
jgi:hypothetical protein